jgi:hypothetical protein
MVVWTSGTALFDYASRSTAIVTALFDYALSNRPAIVLAMERPRPHFSLACSAAAGAVGFQIQIHVAMLAVQQCTTPVARPWSMYLVSVQPKHCCFQPKYCCCFAATIH